jgi:pheromone shutdown protein TraB
MWLNNFRSLIFKARFTAYWATFKFHFKIPDTFTFMKPGLEVKYACEEAEKAGAKTYWLGNEMNDVTWRRLAHETRMNIPHYIYKRL